MGSGGFLLTNYQADFLRHFEMNEDFVCYGSVGEMMEKVEFYLKNDEERERIARKGFEKVKIEHGYHDTLKRMIQSIDMNK